MRNESFFTALAFLLLFPPLRVHLMCISSLIYRVKPAVEVFYVQEYLILVVLVKVPLISRSSLLHSAAFKRKCFDQFCFSLLFNAMNVYYRSHIKKTTKKMKKSEKKNEWISRFQHWPVSCYFQPCLRTSSKDTQDISRNFSSSPYTRWKKNL